MEEADALGYRSARSVVASAARRQMRSTAPTSRLSDPRLPEARARVLRKAQPELLAKGQKLFACRSAN